MIYRFKFNKRSANYDTTIVSALVTRYHWYSWWNKSSCIIEPPSPIYYRPGASLYREADGWKFQASNIRITNKMLFSLRIALCVFSVKEQNTYKKLLDRKSKQDELNRDRVNRAIEQEAVAKTESIWSKKVTLPLAKVVK